MGKDIDKKEAYKVSEDVVAREIEGEMIIVPLTAGIGDMEEELFTLNETGRAIWEKLGKERTLEQIILELTEEYSAAQEEIEEDVIGLVTELYRRNMIVKA